MPTAFHQAATEHLRRLTKVIDQGAIASVKRVYDQAQAELERKLSKAVGKGSALFTVQQHRVMLAQVRQGQAAIAHAMGSASAQATIQTQTESLKSLIASVKKMERQHGGGATVVLPIEEAARFHGVLDRRRTSLLKQNRVSMAKYGAGLVKKIEGHLALSLMTGETTHEAVERVQAAAGTEFWKAERIVRTEQAWAFNATQRDGIAETAKEIGELYMRWTELVDDATGLPLDDRVGADSLALHGQVARPGELFRMPPGAKGVKGELATWSGEHPPDRPNDRASLMPWRPGWDVPGWQLVGGRKVEVKTPKTPGRRPR